MNVSYCVVIISRAAAGVSISAHYTLEDGSEGPERVIINQTANLFLHFIASVIEIPIENFILTGHETGHVCSGDILIGLGRLVQTGGMNEPHLVAGSTPYAACCRYPLNDPFSIFRASRRPSLPL